MRHAGSEAQNENVSHGFGENQELYANRGDSATRCYSVSHFLDETHKTGVNQTYSENRCESV